MIKIIKFFHLKFQKYYIYLVLLLGLFLRLRNILNRDFWYDEAFTGITVKASFWDMIRITINDVHPPFYYMLLKLFAYFFHYSVFGIRFFSVIFGVLGIWAVYLLTRELFGKRSGIFAALITAISPFAIQYSQEGRMYALMSFLVIMGAYFYFRGLSTKNYKYFIFWGFFMGLSWLTHYMGVIFSTIFYLVFVFWNFFEGGRKMGVKQFFKNIIPSKNIIIGYGSALAVFSFWIVRFFDHLRYSGLNNMQWVRPASFSDLLTTAQIFIFGSPLGDLSAGMPSPNVIHNISPSSVLIGVTVFLSIVTYYLLKKEKYRTIYLLSFSFGFMFLIYILSLLGNDYFVSRYLIVSAYFMFILIGVWLSRVNLKLSLAMIIIYAALIFNINPINYSKGYGELSKNLNQYKNNDFYVLNSFDYVIAKYYVGEEHLILYNIDWPQYNPSYWAAIGPSLKRTESYNDLKNNSRALILANIQKDKEKRNDKTFDPVGLPLVAKYDNITLYKPSN